MKKSVTVDELIRIACDEQELADRYFAEGKSDLGTLTDARVSAMITLITVSACSYEKWDNEWKQVYNAVKYDQKER